MILGGWYDYINFIIVFYCYVQSDSSGRCLQISTTALLDTQVAKGLLCPVRDSQWNDEF